MLEATRLTAIHERTTAALELQEREIRAADADSEMRGAPTPRIGGTPPRRCAHPDRGRALAVSAAEQRVRSDDGRASLALVASELAGTESDLRATAAGTPTRLGSGRLHDELHALAARHPSVTAHVDPAAVGDPASEDALRYVASELVANALKHAGAAHITVRLRRVEDDLELEVRDDGVGGVDPTGSDITASDAASRRWADDSGWRAPAPPARRRQR